MPQEHLHIEKPNFVYAGALVCVYGASPPDKLVPTFTRVHSAHPAGLMPEATLISTLYSIADMICKAIPNGASKAI